MICSECAAAIAPDDQTATGPDGIMHYKCFKRGTAQGREITLASLSEEVGRLKRRVQDLEQTVQHHGANIPFRIG